MHQNDLKDEIRLYLNNLKKPSKGAKERLIFEIELDEEALVDTTFEIKMDNYTKFNRQIENLIKDFNDYIGLDYKFREKIILVIIIMELYDDYTRNHSENVARIAKEIATEMKFSLDDIVKTYYAGLLHDIGKVLIPHQILNKPGRLTAQEYQIIKKHPVLGYKMLDKHTELKEISKLVLYHHERWDGKGYPQGLRGNEVPLISQILAVADSWDAMISKRNYRKPLDKEIALKEIRDNKSSQFAPQIVDAFLKVIY